MSRLDDRLQGRTLLPRRLRRRDVTIRHEDDGPLVIHHIPVVVTPYPSKWEHPIRWWRMRHLRHDIKVMDEITPDFKRKFDEIEAEAFINGMGGNN